MQIRYYGDKISKRIAKTPEGFLICQDVPISRTGYQEYLASEIMDNPVNGHKIIPVYRPAEEVFDFRSLASFEGKPVTNEHPEEDVTPDNYTNYACGHVQNVHPGEGKDSNKVLADLYITDPSLINSILNGKREISCGYYAEEKRDASGKLCQTKIRGNHVAVVNSGRAGSKVCIRDRKPRRLDYGVKGMKKGQHVMEGKHVKEEPRKGGVRPSGLARAAVIGGALAGTGALTYGALKAGRAIGTRLAARSARAAASAANPAVAAAKTVAPAAKTAATRTAHNRPLPTKNGFKARTGKYNAHARSHYKKTFYGPNEFTKNIGKRGATLSFDSDFHDNNLFDKEFDMYDEDIYEDADDMLDDDEVYVEDLIDGDEDLIQDYGVKGMKHTGGFQKGNQYRFGAGNPYRFQKRGDDDEEMLDDDDIDSIEDDDELVTDYSEDELFEDDDMDQFDDDDLEAIEDDDIDSLEDDDEILDDDDMDFADDDDEFMDDDEIDAIEDDDDEIDAIEDDDDDMLDDDELVLDYGVKGMKKGQHVMEGKHVKEQPKKGMSTRTKVGLGLMGGGAALMGAGLGLKALARRRGAAALAKTRGLPSSGRTAYHAEVVHNTPSRMKNVTRSLSGPSNRLAAPKKRLALSSDADYEENDIFEDCGMYDDDELMDACGGYTDEDLFEDDDFDAVEDDDDEMINDYSEEELFEDDDDEMLDDDEDEIIGDDDDIDAIEDDDDEMINDYSEDELFEDSDDELEDDDEEMLDDDDEEMINDYSEDELFEDDDDELDSVVSDDDDELTDDDDDEMLDDDDEVIEDDDDPEVMPTDEVEQKMSQGSTLDTRKDAALREIVSATRGISNAQERKSVQDAIYKAFCGKSQMGDIMRAIEKNTRSRQDSMRTVKMQMSAAGQQAIYDSFNPHKQSGK